MLLSKILAGTSLFTALTLAVPSPEPPAASPGDLEPTASLPAQNFTAETTWCGRVWVWNKYQQKEEQQDLKNDPSCWYFTGIGSQEAVTAHSMEILDTRCTCTFYSM